MNDAAVWGFLGVVFTALCAVISNVIVSRNATKELYAKLDKQSELSDAKIAARIDVIESRMDTLTEEVRKHNAFAERIPKLEADMDVLKRQNW